MFLPKKILFIFLGVVCFFCNNAIHGIHVGSYSLDGTDHLENQDRIDVDLEHGWFAVYDGHSALYKPNFLATHLQGYFRDALSQNLDIESSFKQAFKQADEALISGGSTATVALLDETKLTVAWVGDSEAFTIKKNSPPQALITPHDFTGTETDRFKHIISSLPHGETIGLIRRLGVWKPSPTGDSGCTGFMTTQRIEEFGKTDPQIPLSSITKFLHVYCNAVVFDEKTFSTFLGQLRTSSCCPNLADDVRSWIKSFALSIESRTPEELGRHPRPIPEKAWQMLQDLAIFGSGEFCVQCPTALCENDKLLLSVSRSIGDHDVKMYGVISTPEIHTFEVTPEDQFVIIASDGLWDAMSPGEVAYFIKHKYEETTDLNEICKTLSSKARARGSTDDISIVLLGLE